MGINKSKLILKYVTSGKSPRSALPTGNGKIGLLVYGGAKRETITVNNSELYWKGHTGVLPDISDKTKLIKKHISASNFREAECVFSDALQAKNYKPEPCYPLPLCDFILDSCVASDCYDYYRMVDMQTSEVEVSFRDKEGKITRDIFVDKNDVICYRIAGSNGKKVNIDFSISLHDKRFNRDANLDVVNVDIPFESKLDKDYVVFSARNDDGTDFGCVAKIISSGGNMEKSGEKMSVKCADKVVIFAKTFVKADKEIEIKKIMDELSLIKTPYDKLIKEHGNVFNKLITCSEFDLDEDDSNDEVEEDLLDCKTGKINNSFLVKLYYYGKYLFAISNSNLNICSCGILNGDYKAYQSTTNNYLGLSRLYNFNFKTPYASMLKSVFDRFYDNLDDYKKNSSRLYGCRGIFIPSLEAPESGLPGSIAPNVILNFNVASQVCAMLYKYYLITDDLDYIREKGYEIIEETGTFYEEFLKENKTTKVLESPFGISPYSSSILSRTKQNDIHICSNCVVDFASAKNVFFILSKLSAILGKENTEVTKWENLLQEIPDVEVDKNGLIKEFNSNSIETDNSSPYISHLFPYNIGFKPSKTSRDFETLVANSIKYRYSNAMGNFSSNELIDMALALFTCGEGNNGFEILKTLIKNYLNTNLIFNTDDISNMGVGRTSNYSSLNLDKNTCLCACLQNLFVNSSKNNIYLFQNLPKDFNKGCMKGICLDNQIVFDLEFNRKKGVAKLRLKSIKSTTINLFLPKGFKKVKGTDVLVDKQFMVLNGLSLPANKYIKLKILFSNL